MSKDYIDVQGIPVEDIHINEPEIMPDDIRIGDIRNAELLECPNEITRFIPKSELGNEICHICRVPLKNAYVPLENVSIGRRGIGRRVRRGGNVHRRSSSVFQLGCGHKFHSGCLLDHLNQTQTFVTLDTSGNQIEALVPITNIMDNAYHQGYLGTLCPNSSCNKRCYTGFVYMLIESFIGEEDERITTATGHEEYDTEAYCGTDLPPLQEDCCIIAGRKRKTKKLKKSKRTRKQTKKRKQKLKKTKRKNSKK